MINIKTWWQKWWFGFILAGALLGFEIACLILFVKLTPQGSQWLGDLGFNASDYAVYLNYLLQAKSHFLISNLYDNFAQVPRFDAFWSTAGLLIRAGLTPIVTHEILRWGMTVILALAIYATAKTLVSGERRARLTSFLMVSGLSLGWIYAAWRDLGGPEFPSSGPTPPDMVTEFGVAPVVLGGAHMILSFGLELLLMRWIYELICLGKSRLLLPLIIVTLFFTWLHPYFIPLLGCQMLICTVVTFNRHRQGKTMLYFLAGCASLIPAAGYYVWLAILDPAFRNHHLAANQLPLGSIWVWLLILIPLIWAGGRMFFHKVPLEFYWSRNPTWVWFWIASAVFCLLLPFPWQRKYTQGLLIAGVILTLPYWLMVSGSILSKWRSSFKHLLYFFFFIFFISASYLYLFQIQWTALRTDFSYHFYQNDSLFVAWNSLKSNPSSLIISDDPWINLWTPAETGQHVWIGHAHETPNYFERSEQFTEWLKTDKADDFNRFLNENQINAVMATTQANQIKFGKLIDPKEWQKTFEQSQITVWSKSTSTQY